MKSSGEYARCPPQDIKRVLLAVLVSIIVLGLLGTIYQRAMQVWQPSWMACAIVNTAITVPVLIWYLKNFQFLDKQRFLDGYWPRLIAEFWHRDDPWHAYWPSLLILSGVVVLSLISRLVVPGSVSSHGFSLTWTQGGIIFWVPFVEEMVFRVGLSTLLEKIAGIFWGSYLAIMVFVLAHSAPDFVDLWQGRVHFVLGPFLLGVGCQYLWLRYRNVIAIYLLHAVCNATPLVFGLLDQRWLNWLDKLYL